MRLILTHSSTSSQSDTWSLPPDHVKDIRMIYILSGSGHWTVDQQAYLVKPHDLIILRPGQTRHARMIAKQPVRYHALRFSVEGNNNGQPGWLMLPSVTHLKGSMRQDFEAFIRRVTAEHEEKAAYYLDLIDAVATQLFISLARYHLKTTTHWIGEPFIDLETKKMPTIDRVIHYINEHLSEQIEMADLANLAGMSVSHFRRVFGQLTGMSPQKFIIKSRMWRARELLAQGCFYVYEVARAVGYEDSYYFSRLFRKEVGVPPSVYSSKYRVPVVPL